LDNDREPLALQADVDVDGQGEGDAGEAGRHQERGSWKGLTSRLKHQHQHFEIKKIVCPIWLLLFFFVFSLINEPGLKSWHGFDTISI